MSVDRNVWTSHPTPAGVECQPSAVEIKKGRNPMKLNFQIMVMNYVSVCCTSVSIDVFLSANILQQLQIVSSAAAKEIPIN